MADVRPLRVRPFRRLWASGFVTTVGAALTAVAVPLQIYEITGSSAWIGLSGLVGFGPLVCGGLWGGAVADAVDRRRMLLVTSSGIAAASAALGVHALLGGRSVAFLLGMVAVTQGLFGANTAARGVVVARLVAPALRPAANMLQSSVFYLGAVVGPLLAGVLLLAIGVGWLYLLDAVTLVAALWAVWTLPPLPPVQGGARRAGAREIAAGVGYLRTRPILVVCYLADLIAMLFANPVALFPQVAQETFADPAGGGLALGVLYAAPSAGALGAAALSGTFTGLRRHGAAITVAVCVWGLGIAAFGLCRSLLLAAMFLALAGAALIMLSVFRKTVLQDAVSDELRGRMQGIDVTVSAGGPQLAALAHGTVGATLGTSWAISGGGLLTVGAMIAVVTAFPAFWRYRAPVHPDEPVDAVHLTGAPSPATQPQV
ncbi:MFS transporter permease [Parafrankia colletiae]|uniref:MFS transporter permease n=1 Tax=Parafrankia colletiae TaxID=573497 RepID=A0A1S1R8W1_9ACTN|nr:MFS transporter [Parafrankia colletiae]MCK9900766.1 MFS transporter [Frankia sp. Cpl3]OHV42417.1 MFS transporter permease [Parafrankia colletiae]